MSRVKMTNINPDILKEAIKSKNMTYAQFGMAVGLSGPQVQTAMKRGKIRSESIDRIIFLTGISKDELTTNSYEQIETETKGDVLNEILEVLKEIRDMLK